MNSGGFHRVIAYREGIIGASAQAVWTLLIDWASTLSWFPRDSSGSSGSAGDLVSVELQGECDEIPRTRVITLRNGEVHTETLLYQDDVARRIYYDLDQQGIGGMARNYLASTAVDEIDGTRCRIECSSRFDVPRAFDPQAVRAIVESVYDNIIRGIDTFLARKANGT